MNVPILSKKQNMGEMVYAINRKIFLKAKFSSSMASILKFSEFEIAYTILSSYKWK